MLLMGEKKKKREKRGKFPGSLADISSSQHLGTVVVGQRLPLCLPHPPQGAPLRGGARGQQTAPGQLACTGGTQPPAPIAALLQFPLFFSPGERWALSPPRSPAWFSIIFITIAPSFSLRIPVCSCCGSDGAVEAAGFRLQLDPAPAAAARAPARGCRALEGTCLFTGGPRGDPRSRVTSGSARVTSDTSKDQQAQAENS